MPREVLVVIGDIVREVDDLSEAIYNAISKFLLSVQGILVEIVFLGSLLISGRNSSCSGTISSGAF